MTTTTPCPLADARTAPNGGAPTREPALPRTMTFDEADWRILARHWYPVAQSSEVTEGPLGVTLLDKPLVVYRIGDEVVVADDLCTHRGMQLSLGTDQGDGKGIMCPYHGLRFGSAGRCIAIPAHPEGRIPEKMHLTAYGAVERHGLVWACLSAMPGDEPTIPPVPHWDDGGFQRINCPPIDIDAFAGRQVEGFLDVAHFAFVHEATFADRDNAVVPDYTPVPEADGFSVRYVSSVANVPHGVEADIPEGFEWIRDFRLHVPFSASLVVHFPRGGKLSMLNAACPVSAKRTRLFDARCRNFDTDQPVEDVHEFNRRIFEEDRAMVEAQKPEALPLDPRLEVHIPADKSSIAYRRALRHLGLSTFFTA